MDQEQLNQLVEKIVLAKFHENEELVAKGLAKDLDWENGWERTISQAVANAVIVSTRLSVQTILDLLLGTGAFKVSEEILRPQLTVIRGGADPEAPEFPDSQSPQ